MKLERQETHSNGLRRQLKELVALNASCLDCWKGDL